MYREDTKLVLGRGEVYLNRFTQDTKTGLGEIYLGNTPSFQMDREIERMARTTAYRGRKHETRGAVISEKLTIRMTTDHMSRENMDLWLSATVADVTVGNEYVPYNENMTVYPGRYYQLGSTLIPGGVRHVDSLAVSAGGTALVNGVDYLWDKVSARLFILPTTSRVPSGGQLVSVTYLKRPSTVGVVTPEAKEVYGALRYIAKDPHGPRTDYWFPQVRIAPRGAVEMKGDEFRQISFDVTAIRLNPVVALVYAQQDGKPPMAITADTTLITADSTRYSADNDKWEINEAQNG